MDSSERILEELQAIRKELKQISERVAAISGDTYWIYRYVAAAIFVGGCIFAAWQWGWLK